MKANDYVSRGKELMHHPEQVPDDIDIERIRAWVLEAGRIALTHHRRRGLRFKDDGTPATSADEAIESYLRNRISERYPQHQIIGEEKDRERGNECAFTWIIDPIDGTRAFASGLPIWGISVGVLKEGKPHTGVFYMPAVDEIYSANASGAFCNDYSLSTPSPADLEDPLTFLAVPSNAHLEYDIAYPRVRSLGSTAAHLAYVARGAAIGALTRHVKIWDLAGVLPLLNQTDIALTYLSGAPFDIRELIDGSPTPEPLVAAGQDFIDRIRNRIRVL